MFQIWLTCLSASEGQMKLRTLDMRRIISWANAGLSLQAQIGLRLISSVCLLWMDIGESQTEYAGWWSTVIFGLLVAVSWVLFSPSFFRLAKTSVSWPRRLFCSRLLLASCKLLLGIPDINKSWHLSILYFLFINTCATLTAWLQHMEFNCCLIPSIHE